MVMTLQLRVERNLCYYRSVVGYYRVDEHYLICCLPACYKRVIQDGNVRENNLDCCELVGKPRYWLICGVGYVYSFAV